MEINQPAKFGDHRHYSSKNITFLVDEGQNYTYSQLNLLLLFSLNYMVCHVPSNEIS